MSKIRLGIAGGGPDSLIGIVHRIAAQMFDRYELIGGVFDPDWDKNSAFGARLQLNPSRIYKDFDALIAGEKALPPEERMEVISVLTPNFLHFSMAKKLLENDFHVICEKPLTTTYAEAQILENIQKEKQAIFAVTYTYTGYPMVRQMKHMIAEERIGEVQRVDLQYYQGWINPIIHDTDKRANTWRLQPEKSGISCCVGDIGTHAFDMLEYVTGLRVSSVLADLNTVYNDNTMDVDATILVRLENGAKGVIRVSQIATGEENNFQVAIYGRKGALKWEQENPNYLNHLTEDQPYQILKRGNPYNSDFSQDGVKIPSGHPEGIFDAMANIYKGVAKALRSETAFSGEYPSMEDGVRGMHFIEQVVNSHNQGNVWIALEA
ncbi:MAG: Gfo/Idh/MocA family protein [Flavobacteriaceae bacterium]